MLRQYLLSASALVLLSHLIPCVKAQQSFLSSKSEYWFSEPIRIAYDVRKSGVIDKTKLWIGIYSSAEPDPYYDFNPLWSSICGDGGQEAYYDGCDEEIAKGAITFKAEDPNLDSDGEFPIPADDWYACLFYYDVSEDTNTKLGECAPFRVKSLPPQVLNGVEIGPINADVKTMTLTVDWSSSIPIVKQWIGIIPVDDIEDGVLPYANATYPWLYTGCNNQSGDQEENNDCSVRKNQGKVTFNTDTIDRYYNVTAWPPYKGQYKICLCTHYLPPYTPDTYKCMKDVLSVPNLY